MSHHFEQNFWQIVSIRVKTLTNTNLVTSRHIKGEKGPHPVDVCHSKTSLLKSLLAYVSCLASPGKLDLATYNAKMEGRQEGMLKKGHHSLFCFFRLKTRELRVGIGTLKPCIKRKG